MAPNTVAILNGEDPPKPRHLRQLGAHENGPGLALAGPGPSSLSVVVAPEALGADGVAAYVEIIFFSTPTPASIAR